MTAVEQSRAEPTPPQVDVPSQVRADPQAGVSRSTPEPVQPSTPPDTAPATGPAAPEALPAVLRIVGAVVAPTTLLTGLLFYFGRQHATALFGYLRVPLTVFDLTAPDYLVRSVDGLFVPLALTAGAVLTLHWAPALLVRIVPARTRRRLARHAAVPTLLAGLALVAAAVVGARDIGAFPTSPELPGLCLVGGVLLVAAGVHLAAAPTRATASTRGPLPARLAEWGAVFLLVAVGAFWAAGNYASGVGRSRAVQIEGQLSATPDTVLFSEKSLGLHVDGVTEHVCGDDDAAYRYRYDGLKLIFQSGSQYLFLPAGWTRDHGSAIVIPRTDSLRLEFSAPGRAQVGSC